MFKRNLIAIALASSSVSLFAAEPVDNAKISNNEQDEVIIVLGKVPRAVSDVIGAVSIIDSDTIEQHLVHDISDLMRYQAGINIVNSGTRFGQSSIAIRGISGNRVTTEIDGVPVADQFSIGSYSNSGRSSIDTDLIKQVEILRGPASSIYGSDAIGGVVSFITKKPVDLLSQTEGDVYFSAKTGYYSVDNSQAYSINSAFGAEQSSVLISASRRKGHQFDNQSNSELGDDVQDNETQSFLVKYFLNLSDNQELSFSYDYFKRSSETEINSYLGLGRFRSTTALSGDDKSSRKSYAINYEFVSNLDWLEGGVIRYYSQETDTEQLTDETRFSRGKNYSYDRDFNYAQDIDGLRLNLYTNFSTQNTTHQIGYGVEWSKTRTTELRDALQTNTDTNISTSVILSEQFPLRDFPISQVKELGVYINDEIEIEGTGISIIPAIRWDQYKLDPQPDAIYLEDNTATQVVSIKEVSLSPKLGVQYQLSESSNIYAQYIKGFRAPPFEDANIGLDMPMFNIRAIPNPDLKSETTKGYELGYNYSDGNHQFDLVGFYNDYKDFIQTKVNLGFDPVSERVLFQSQNIDRAKIYGTEVNYRFSISNAFTNNDALSLYTNLFWSKGVNKETNDALNSVEPNHAQLGVEWLNGEGNWSLGMHFTLVAAKDDLDELEITEDNTDELFKTAGYGTLDLIANYHINEDVTLSAAVYNLTDTKYWQWSDVNGMISGDPLLETYSSPGMNGSIQLKMKW